LKKHLSISIDDVAAKKKVSKCPNLSCQFYLSKHQIRQTKIHFKYIR